MAAEAENKGKFKGCILSYRMGEIGGKLLVIGIIEKVSIDTK